MEDDPDAWRKPWVYDVWHREYIQSQEEYEREFKQRREENHQRRVAGEDARYNLWRAKIAEFDGGITQRNWAIWRRYKAGGVTLKQVGDEFGITTERVRQISIKCNRQVRKALNHNWNNVPDEVRNATLGVEFVFRNEVTFEGWNGDMRGWDQLELKEHGSAYNHAVPDWRTSWGEQDTKPAKPRKVYTYYKVVIEEEGANHE
jgi:hypothetical protein